MLCMPFTYVVFIKATSSLTAAASVDLVGSTSVISRGRNPHCIRISECKTSIKVEWL